MTDLGFLAFDADNHYYEALDAFTRHIEPRFRKRAVQWAEIAASSGCSSAARSTTSSPTRH